MSTASERVLSRILPEVLSTDPIDLETYGKDWTRLYAPNPLGIAFPRSTAEVAEILKICCEEKISVVPSGGRTGLAGGALAHNGELVLSLKKLNKIGKPNLLSMTLDVEAGAITQAVHQACEPFGVTWPVDFGSKGSSTVGGNIATNAGGINVIRYGMTRNWVLGLVVVTMTGQILKLNGPLEKNNTGLDLKHLFIGSEGILGVVTEATLKLTRQEVETDLYFFGLDSMSDVFALFESARQADLYLMAFETFSHNCFEASRKGLGLESPFSGSHGNYVIVETQGAKTEAWIESVFEKELVSEGVEPKSSQERSHFWKIRESIAEFLADKGLNHSNDISIPVYNLKAFIDEWRELFQSKYPAWELFIFGHIGDGNLHIHTIKPADMSLSEFAKTTERVDESLFNLVNGYGGSISAEHGIGVLKKKHLGKSKSTEELEILRSIKKILDPHWLLNPGKIIDP